MIFCNLILVAFVVAYLGFVVDEPCSIISMWFGLGRWKHLLVLNVLAVNINWSLVVK